MKINVYTDRSGILDIIDNIIVLKDPKIILMRYKLTDFYVNYMWEDIQFYDINKKQLIKYDFWENEMLKLKHKIRYVRRYSDKTIILSKYEKIIYLHVINFRTKEHIQCSLSGIISNYHLCHSWVDIRCDYQNIYLIVYNDNADAHVCFQSKLDNLHFSKIEHNHTIMPNDYFDVYRTNTNMSIYHLSLCHSYYDKIANLMYPYPDERLLYEERLIISDSVENIVKLENYNIIDHCKKDEAIYVVGLLNDNLYYAKYPAPTKKRYNCFDEYLEEAIIPVYCYNITNKETRMVDLNVCDLHHSGNEIYYCNTEFIQRLSNNKKYYFSDMMGILSEYGMNEFQFNDNFIQNISFRGSYLQLNSKTLFNMDENKVYYMDQDFNVIGNDIYEFSKPNILINP